MAIIGDDLSDTSIDDTFKDPDYHLSVILDRQPTPIPRAMSEQEEPTRRYPSRIHKQPQRYFTVNAITVKQSDDYLNKNTKQTLFQTQKKTNENKEKQTKRHYNKTYDNVSKTNDLSISNLFLMILCMSMISVSTGDLFLQMARILVP